jgi:uncharacterized protein YbjT (DUF2867 family)
MNNRTALLLGATGLVGEHCLDLLLQDDSYSQVITLGRKWLERDDTKLVQHVIEFDHLSDVASLIKAQDVFCCLGTTIKTAGSQEAFRKVDFTYPVEIARMASENGAEQFLIVTALGANAKSSFFYNRVKGEVEDAVRELRFKSVQIFRPSLLLGERKESRFGEKVGEQFLKAFKFLLVGGLRKYRAIKASDVAHAMVRMAKARPVGVHVYESDRIKEIARYGQHGK